MRASTRRSAVVLALALPVALLFGVMPAGAADGGVVVFRGVAGAPGLCFPGAALVTSSCGPTGLPGDPDVTGWTLTAPNAADPLDFCVGAAAAGGVAVFAGGGSIQGTCKVSGAGIVDATLGLAGGWCGLSHGIGTGTVTINTSVATDTIEWITSVGTVLPITDGNLTNSTFTAGVVDSVGALGGGNCATAPSVAFNVVGVLASVTA